VAAEEPRRPVKKPDWWDEPADRGFIALVCLWSAVIWLVVVVTAIIIFHL